MEAWREASAAAAAARHAAAVIPPRRTCRPVCGSGEPQAEDVDAGLVGERPGQRERACRRGPSCLRRGYFDLSARQARMVEPRKHLDVGTGHVGGPSRRQQRERAQHEERGRPQYSRLHRECRKMYQGACAVLQGVVGGTPRRAVATWPAWRGLEPTRPACSTVLLHCLRRLVGLIQLPATESSSPLVPRPSLRRKFTPVVEQLGRKCCRAG